MNFNPIKVYFIKRNKRNIRNYMRGYRLLIKNNNLDFLARLKNDILKTSLSSHKNYSHYYFFGRSFKDLKLSLRQFL